MSRRGESEIRAQDGADLCADPFAQILADHQSARRQERLASVIFDDIIPRLHLLHHELSATDAERAFTSAEITEFADILIRDDIIAADGYLLRMRERGHSEETIFLGLMAETARRLGTLWEDDRCSFVDVTIGVARLQKMLCVISGVSEPAVADSRQRVALCALDGESHVFGVDMVACFLRHSCWDVALQKSVEGPDVAGMVSQSWFAVLGFTLSAETGLEALCRCIQSGRAASMNSSIGVLVGGPLFREQPNLVAQVGADAMATDAASACLLAKQLLLRQQKRGATRRADGAQFALRFSDGGKTGGVRAGSGAQSLIQSSNS